MARFYVLIVVLALSCCISFSEGRSFRELLGEIFEEDTYDKLTLVESWAPSFCEKSPCDILSTYKKNWTIHGLWPFKNNVKNTPVDCTGTFNDDDIKDIRSEMLLKWPTYKRGGSVNDFWKHEYEKHGTCASDLPTFSSAKKYFRGTMDLYDRYNIKRILADGTNAVRPSDTIKYPLAYITTALRKGLGVDPAVYCVEKKKIQYLWEVRMCFSKTLASVTCGAALAGGGKCNPLKKVLYPTFLSKISTTTGTSADAMSDVAEMLGREMMKMVMKEEEAEEEEEEEMELWRNVMENPYIRQNSTRL
ncbi:ribonuclease Oy-like [Lytechinus variegatus]|uniref:ribonuclease Oy-like n=1 Tax=Lytechinus variegatus TaxID=7654 RepID=UPI001BB0E1EE|nr:ribonuclease Oy-like [Lytechinus variegatus]